MKNLLLIFLLFPSICLATSYSITNGNLLTVNGNGNLGIGSTVPGQNLDVFGTLRTNNFILPGNGAASGFILQTSGSTGIGTWVPAPSGGGGSGTPGGSATQLQYQVNGTTFGGVSGSSVNSNSNIGIGSTNPGDTLDIQGTIRTTNFTLTGNNAAQGSVLMASGTLGIGTWSTISAGGGSGTVNSGTTANGAYYASSTTAVSPTASITFTGASSGNNIGIGSVAPGSLLDVQGTARIFGNVGIGTSFPNNVFVVGSTGQFQLQNNGSEMVINSVLSGTNAVNIQTNSQTSGSAVAISSSANSTGAILSVSTSGGSYSGNVLSVTSSGTGNAALFTAGNVGIGTAAPSSRLEVGNRVFDVQFGGNVGVGTNAPNGVLDVEGTVSPVVFMARTPTSGTNQNIGIGSFNPGAILDVQGTIRTSGFIINTKSTTGIGWSDHNSANQACNTTCGTSACVIGLDAGTVGVLNSNFVACSDATADDCVCSGP